MKKDRTELVCIIDMSGSMEDLTTDTIGGYNSLIAKQREVPGEAFVTTVLFNDRYYMISDHVEISKAEPLTAYQYRPIGMTALLDAVGKTIDSVGQRLNITPEDERPDKVIFAITTDGYENSSKDYCRYRIKEMIQHQQEKYSWEFLFIGAGIDAYDEAGSLGIDSTHTAYVTTDSLGTATAYNSVSNAFTSVRSSATKMLNTTAWKNGQTANDTQ